MVTHKSSSVPLSSGIFICQYLVLVSNCEKNVVPPVHVHIRAAKRVNVVNCYGVAFLIVHTESKDPSFFGAKTFGAGE